MTDYNSHTPFDPMDPNHRNTRAASAQQFDLGHGQPLNVKSPVEVDTDNEASSLGGSDFLEGSWATVSSEDAGASHVEDLASSGDEGEGDTSSELSPRHTASAEHSESEIDAFSDSTNESDDGRPANDRTYEYVTDQSWTDPDKSTPSNSTLSTLHGSSSRGLAGARTPMHSRSSTLTRAHLIEHAQYQLGDVKAQPILAQRDLKDSQVELVFPRIAGEFGTGSVDTITSSTPLLPIEEQSNTSYDPRPKQHNFRALASLQLSEDDYILLANATTGSRSQPLVVDSNLASGATAHHAFPAHTLDSRRSEKRQRFDLVGDGIDQRGKCQLDSEFQSLAKDQHPESCEREQNTQQKQFSEQLIREIPERVVDIDSDGYERLSATEAYSDSLCEDTDNLPWESIQGPSGLTARLIGLRTNCPVQRNWLDAVSRARSRGEIIIDSSTSVANEAPFLRMAPDRDLTFDSMPSLDDSPVPAEATESKLMAQDDVMPHTSRAPAPLRFLHLSGIDQVKAIVTIVAIPLLAIIVLSRLSSVVPERTSANDNDRVPDVTNSKTVLVTCSPASEEYVKTRFHCVHVCNTDMPVTSFVAAETATSEPWESVSSVKTILATIAVPTSCAEQMKQDTILSVPSTSVAPCKESVSVSATSISALAIPTALVDPPMCLEKDTSQQEYHQSVNSDHDTSSNAPDVIEEPTADWGMCDRRMAFAVLPVANASWITRFFEHSLALTTALDHTFRAVHESLAKLVAKYRNPLSRSPPIRNSGRRLFKDHGAAIFEETDAMKKRIRSEMSALLEVVDQHLQELALDVDKAIKLSREKLVTAIKETADGVEKHIGVEIPLPAFMARDPDRTRTKSTVSTWAEKFWQTLHHATVTLII